MTATGDSDRYPVPWLGENGSLIQPPAGARAGAHLPFQETRRLVEDLHRDGDGLTTGQDGNTMTPEMKDVPAVDQPRWPAPASVATGARMSFKMVWGSTGEAIRIEKPAQHLRFRALASRATWKRRWTFRRLLLPGVRCAGNVDVRFRDFRRRSKRAPPRQLDPATNRPFEHPMKSQTLGGRIP